MTKKLIKTIVFYVGCLAVIVAGLLYLILTDLKFGNTAAWLLGVSVLAFGSGICGLFSVSFKEKKTVMYILKGAAVALCIGLIILIFVSKVSSPFVDVSEVLKADANTAVTIPLVFAFISAPFLAADIALNLIWKDEDEE